MYIQLIGYNFTSAIIMVLHRVFILSILFMTRLIYSIQGQSFYKCKYWLNTGFLGVNLLIRRTLSSHLHLGKYNKLLLILLVEHEKNPSFTYIIFYNTLPITLYCGSKLVFYELLFLCSFREFLVSSQKFQDLQVEQVSHVLEWDLTVTG